MNDFISTVNKDELVNLDAIEAIFIKNPPSVNPAHLGKTKDEINKNITRIAKSFKVIARGTSTYTLFEGTLEECKNYIDTI
jgi:hypothetical protein